MVNHLTFEELLEFNSMNYDEARTGELPARVTTHLRTCAECRKALSAVQNADAVISRYARREYAPEKTVEKRKEKLF